MAENTYLPDDIIFSCILTRLPVKTIGRCRCVATKWRSTLSTQKFAREHLTSRMKHESQGIILGISDGPTSYCVLNVNKEEKNIVSQWFDPPDGNNNSSLKGTSNGLVLGVHFGDSEEETRLNLFNPVTLENRSIPNFPNSEDYGLGYDVKSKDYKIFALIVNDARQNYFSVYSLKHNTWGSLRKTAYDGAYSPVGGCYVNGALHYIARGGNVDHFVLVAFNMYHEDFTEVPYPKELEGHRKFTWGAVPCLAVIRGCIGLFGWSKPFNDGYDVWVMVEYGVQESWKKYRLPLDLGSWIYDYVGVLEDDTIVLRRSDNVLVTVSLKNMLPELPARYDGEYGIRRMRSRARIGFTESLISPRFDV